MVETGGKNKFNECFDTFEWSAPYYENPQEVMRALQSIKFKGKKIKHVKVIGIARNVGDTNNGRIYETITEAGIDLEETQWSDYENIDNVLVPWEVRACEPLQFVFEDNTTLEILPTESGGARLSANAIPIEIVNGLNFSNLDSDVFFNEAIGKTIRNICIRIEKNTKQYIEEFSLDREKPYEEIRTSYRFRIELEYPLEIELIQSWESWYKISMYGDFIKIPYARVKSAEKQTNQICIVNGRDGGGTFWICPCHSKENNEKHIFFYNFGMSIDDYYVADYLAEFLFKYFDPSIQNQDNGECNSSGEREFDWYGGNLYSKDSMRKLLQDMKETITMLLSNPDDLSIKNIIDRFSWHNYTDKHKDQLTEDELFQLKKKDIPTAVDFYKRFVKRTESMLELQGIEIISFAGP